MSPDEIPDQISVSSAKRIQRQKKRALMLHRIETAITSGQINLYDDWIETDEIALTGGELVLLLRILFPEDYFVPPPPPEPTFTAPGSPARVVVIADRIARGQSAFHPNDATPTPENEYELDSSFKNSMDGVAILGWGKRSPDRPKEK